MINLDPNFTGASCVSKSGAQEKPPETTCGRVSKHLQTAGTRGSGPVGWFPPSPVTLNGPTRWEFGSNDDFVPNGALRVPMLSPATTWVVPAGLRSGSGTYPSCNPPNIGLRIKRPHPPNIADHYSPPTGDCNSSQSLQIKAAMYR